MSIENRYATVFGSKTSSGRLNTGFFLVFSGILLGLAALVLFFTSYAFDDQSGLRDPNATYWLLKRIALPMGAIAFATILAGVTTALPTRTALRTVSWLGFGLCAVATFLVAWHYPLNFNSKVEGDMLPLDLGVYVAGMAFLLASVVTSLVAYYLGSLQPGKADAEDEDDGFSSSYEVPDWVVEKDIEYAMKKFGVELVGGKEDKGIRVNINDSLGGNVKIGGLGKARVVQLDAEQVDVGVSQLSRTNPRRSGSLPSEWTDDAVSKLRNFRQQKAADPKAYQPKIGFWSRLWGWLTGRTATQVDRAAGPIALGAGASAGTPRPRVTMTPAASKPSGVAASPPRRGKTIVIEDEK